MRNAQRDISIFRGALPPADSVSLAAQLLGQLTSPSQAAIKAEMRQRLQETLDNMDPVDREVIALRHFEQLTSDLVARTQLCVEMLLEDALLGWDRIDNILMVGGSSRMPQVTRMLAELSGKAPAHVPTCRRSLADLGRPGTSMRNLK